MKTKGKCLIFVSLVIFTILLILLYLDRVLTADGDIVFQTIQEVDTRILLFINPNGDVVFFNSFFWILTTYFDIGITVLVVLLFSLSFFINALKKYQFILFVVLLVFLINSYASNHLKDLFERSRPQEFSSIEEFFFGYINPIELKLGTNSFPSGHTSTAFSMMIPLIIYVKPKWLKAGFLIYACLQGLSRVWLGAHFPVDVLMGAFFGILIGVIFFYVSRSVITRIDPKYLRLD